MEEQNKSKLIRQTATSNLIDSEISEMKLKPIATKNGEKSEDIKNKKIEPVAKVKMVKKKPWYKRFLNACLADDSQDIKHYILVDTVLPAIKNMIFDTFSGALEMSLFGTCSGSRNKCKNGSKSYVTYSGIYSNNRNRSARSSEERSKKSINDIFFSSRGDAEEVLSTMIEMIDTYDEVSVGSLYQLVGITPDFTDDKYGWTNLSTASVSRNRDGYYINLPRPQILD